MPEKQKKERRGRPRGHGLVNQPPPVKPKPGALGPTGKRASRKAPGLTLQQRAFLRAYYESGGNVSEAERAIGVCGGTGARLLKATVPYVAAWLREEGLGEDYLREKLLEGLNAHEQRVFCEKGAITLGPALVAWGPRQGFLGLAMKHAGMLKEPELPPGAGTGTLRVIVEVQGPKDTAQGGVQVEVVKPEDVPR